MTRAITPRGWCPGLARPMLSGDGLLVRLRLRGSAISAAQLDALADCATRCGNGLVDMTSRGNLQLRGVRAEALADVTNIAIASGLADAHATHDAAGTLATSPLAGLDNTALIDSRGLAETIDHALANDETLRALPAKFAFVIDDGGACSLGGLDADIRLEAFADDNAPRCAIRLGGNSAQSVFLGTCAPGDATRIALDLAAIFLRRRDAGGSALRRMRDCLGARHIAAFGKAAGLQAGAVRPPARPPADVRRFMGAIRLGEMSFIGAAAPFGRLDAPGLRALAAAARLSRAEDVRITPWRIALVPCASAHEAHMLSLLEQAGLIIGPADPRLKVAACSGLHACASATTDVRADAMRFAELFTMCQAPGIALHVSGCAKGCAHSAATPATLVGHDGVYDLVFNGNAHAQAALHNLSPDAAKAHIARAHLAAERAA